MPPTLQLSTRTPADTREVGRVVSEVLRGGDVVALTGELGAGKTCFVQGAAAGLGVTERVTSPSFVLRKDYRGRLEVMHLDVYRLDTLQDVLDVGYDEDAGSGRVTFVEWGDAMAPLLPSDHLRVELTLGEVDTATAPVGDGELRRITISAHGPDWARRVDVLDGPLRQWATDRGRG